MRAVTTALGSGWTSEIPVDIPLTDIARGDGVLFARGEIGFAGRGAVARIAADEAVGFLGSIEHHDEVGATPGPIALGTLDFEPGSNGQLLVPRVVVGRDAHRSWVTVIEDDDRAGTGPDDLALSSPGQPRLAANSYQIRPLTSTDTYIRAVETARDTVRAGDLTKVVIARAIEVTAEQPIDVHGVLRRLAASFSQSYRYSIDGLIGASPELLVAVDDDEVTSHPLAGTAPRTGDPETDERLAEQLVTSTKDQIEHRVVIDVVHDTLLAYSSYLDWEPEPSIVTVANVQHLGTLVHGRLRRPRPSVIELVRALSPTPALGGHPREAALDLIRRVEGIQRGRYGGAVGWVDAHGNGTWAVTIRCAELDPTRTRARLMAGGGIVADSDPLAELAETQSKFQAMLSALVRP